MTSITYYNDPKRIARLYRRRALPYTSIDELEAAALRGTIDGNVRRACKDEIRVNYPMTRAGFAWSHVDPEILAETQAQEHTSVDMEHAEAFLGRLGPRLSKALRLIAFDGVLPRHAAQAVGLSYAGLNYRIKKFIRPWARDYLA